MRWLELVGNTSWDLFLQKLLAGPYEFQHNFIGKGFSALGCNFQWRELWTYPDGIGCSLRMRKNRRAGTFEYESPHSQVAALTGGFLSLWGWSVSCLYLFKETLWKVFLSPSCKMRKYLKSHKFVGQENYFLQYHRLQLQLHFSRNVLLFSTNTM